MDNGIKENANVGLHDCRTNRIKLEDEYITFYFPDGFYFIEDGNAVQSGRAEMRCHFADKYEDNFSAVIYRKNIFGKTVREEWTDKFLPAVNGGDCEFEFVYTYRSYHSVLFKGYIWQNRKPWWRECEVELRTDEISYSRSGSNGGEK